MMKGRVRGDYDVAQRAQTQMFMLYVSAKTAQRDSNNDEDGKS